MNSSLHKERIVIALCPENSQELSDFVKILNAFAQIRDLKIKIISLSKLYHDRAFNDQLRDAKFKYDLLEIQPIFKDSVPFPYLNPMKKILTVLLKRRVIYEFAMGSDIFLVGIQAVFQRMLYYCPGAKGRTVSFQRGIMFPINAKTTRGVKISSVIFKKISTFLGIDYLMFCKSGVGYTDYYLVIGDANRKYLELAGIPVEKIFIVGSPTHDELGKRKIEVLGSCQKPQKIYYITSAFEWVGDTEGESYQRRKVGEIIKFAKKNKNVELTLRAHPRESEKKYREMEKKHPHVKIDYYGSTDIFSDLSKYDVICDGFSMVMFEAMLLGKPTAHYLLKGEIHRYKELLEFLGVRYFTDMAQIADILKPGRLEELVRNQKEVVKKVIYYNSNEAASKRIADLLATLCGGEVRNV